MASRGNSAPATENSGQPAKAHHHASDVKKPGQRELVSARRSTRLQAQVSSNLPTLYASQPQLVQASSALSGDVFEPQRIKRKRLHDSEADDSENAHLAKQPRTRLSPPAELSEKNLRLFNRENMDSASNITPGESTKRSSSRRTMTSSTGVSQDIVSVLSQRSSSSTAHYRYRHLRSAQVFVHSPSPPAEIQTCIDAIVKAKVPEERQTKLLAISQRFHEGCAQVVRAAVGEDDCMNVLRIALQAMDRSTLILREKTDWQVELKPTIRPSAFDLSLMDGYQQQEANDIWARPRKRQQQQTGLGYISPEPSKTGTSFDAPDNNAISSETMPPPKGCSSSDNDKYDSPIKKPRPDMTIGLEYTALVSALSSQNLNNDDAVEFLDLLQTTMVRRQPNGPDEPMLCSVPMHRDSDLVFPFAVVEGKAYSTGKPIFEAENQAAVSGACGLKILLCLDELVKNASISSDVLPTSSSSTLPLLFSICTEGPIHELWVHYTIIENGVRKFNMRLLKSCHGMLLEDVVGFLVAVDNVLGWGTGEFLDGVVERLGKVARRVRA
ncbi:hypothetical protein MMC29_001900 [Sticta canariensis]|nr:hypothetical protein [Sticta canariensis]